MPRLVLGIGYEGTAYRGWQRQASLSNTVQQHVESALSRVGDTAMTTTCGGRTDAGVHAIEQVVHVDTEKKRPDRAWVLGSNRHLPRDIRIRWVRCMDPSFHARYSAVSRRYQYIIDNGPIASSLWYRHSAWVRHPLDAGIMHRAAQSILGEHDFSAFRGSGCQSASPMRCVQQIRVMRRCDQVVIDIWANAFLYHMVRNIVGALIPIGLGHKPAVWMHDLLVGCDRTLGAKTAPPQGLYLVKIDYGW